MASDAKVSFSSKAEYRAVIRYLYLKGKTGQEIHCELTNIYGSSAPSYALFKFWVGEFKRCRTSLEDETRSGRPSDATDEEMCNKVRDLVYSDRRIKVEEMANALHISHGSVSTTLHNRLGMHKLTARWVPKSLSDEQMATRASVYSALLKRFWSKEDTIGQCESHTGKIAMDAVKRNEYELIPHPAYSPDLAPGDYFLFPNLKKDICGRHFRSNEEVVVS